MLDDLKTIFNVNENGNESVNENENESANENENESVNENDNENDNENKSDDGQYYLEQRNNNFKEIDETKSFENHHKIILDLGENKIISDAGDYWDIKYYEDNKETNLRLFKLKLAHILNNVDDNLFTEIFGFKSVELADKLINTTSKEDNQMIIDHIEIKKGKISEQEYSKFVIQPAYKRGGLLDTVKVILDFNKTIQPYLT